MAEDRNKILLFDHIYPHDKGMLLRHAARGRIVKIFDFGFHATKQSSLKAAFDSGVLKSIYINGLSPAHGEAIDIAQGLSLETLGIKIFSAIRKLYGSEDVSYLFRKCLVEDIFKFCFIREHLKKEAANCPNAKITLVSRHFHLRLKFLRGATNLGFELPKNVEIRRSLLGELDEVRDALIYKGAATASVILRALFCGVGWLLNRSKIQKESREFAVSVGSHLEVARAGERGYDSIVDGLHFSNDNFFFFDVFNMGPTLLQRERAKGRVFLSFKEQTRFSALVRWRWDTKFLASAFRALGETFFSFYGSASVWKLYFIALVQYLDWNILLQLVDFKHFIYTNQESLRTLASNLFLQQRGKQTWNYSIFLGGSYIVAKDGDLQSVRNHLWSFLVSEHFVGVNETVCEYYRLHYQKVKYRHAIGSIYAGMIQGRLTADERSNFLQNSFPLTPDPLDKRLISVFDTTFFNSPDCLTNFEDCLSFYDDMIKLLLEHEDYLMVFKPSKTPGFFMHPHHPCASLRKGPLVLDRWRALKAHPRVFWPTSLDITTKKFVDFSFNNSIIAASDIVITHCMSSPTAEALGARKKAFWYESGRKHCGTDYDRIPGLVVHGYAELHARVRELLNVSNEEYDLYLDRYVRGKVESYLDGQALNRFRILLTDRTVNSQGEEECRVS